jgi:hypothetical protein
LYAQLAVFVEVLAVIVTPALTTLVALKRLPEPVRSPAAARSEAIGRLIVNAEAVSLAAVDAIEPVPHTDT